MGRVEARRIESGEEITERLGRAMRVSAVVLFGSRARGDFTQHSDVDIAVVSADFEDEPRMFRRVERIQDALLALGHFDVVGLSPAELEALDCLLVLDIVHDGQVLFDDGTFVRSRRLLVQQLQEGCIERIQGGWRIGRPQTPRDGE